MSGRGPGRPRETSHAEIRTVARRLFIEQGYAATSLAQIAAELGISRTTLFAYYPAKSDLVWVQFDRAVERLRAMLDAAEDVPVVDLVVNGLLITARYSAAEHDEIAGLMRVVQADEELRAQTFRVADEVTRLLVDVCVRRAPEVDPMRIDMVTRALVAVAARCTAIWAQEPSPGDLDAFTEGQLRPVAEALRPLVA